MIYYTEQYSRIVATFEGGIADTFSFYQGEEYAKFNFVKRDISDVIPSLETGKYFDIISPFDYGGIEYSNHSILEPFFLSFSHWCHENQIVSLFIRFAPMYSFDYDILSQFIELKKVNELIYIDLKTEFWSAYSRGRKSNINRISKMNYHVKEVSLNNFYPLYLDSMQRNQAHEYFFFKYEVLEQLLESGFIRIFGIYIDEILVSSMMVLDDDTSSYYFLGASLSNLISLDANAMLFHEVTIILKSESRNIFFLGGGREGVYNFKQRFSKRTLPYYIGYKIYNTTIYNELVNLTQRVGNQFFPQYREKII